MGIALMRNENANTRVSGSLSKLSWPSGEQMIGEKSRLLKVGDNVCWQNDQADRGTVIETNWSGLTIKWGSRGEQRVLHNDMGNMSLVSKK
jgi:hypothetical protein